VKRTGGLLRSTLLAGVAAFGLCPALAQEGPGLGVEIAPDDYAAWDISIQPDGRGLPPGSGNAAEGAEIYAVKCASCHGAEGAGQPNDRLVGGHGTLTQLAQVRTIGSFWPYASTVFDYIRRAMPFQAPQSLSDDEVYALTAYLLALNGIIEEREQMNASTLARVQMPNSDGFVLAYPRRADR
jgi:cytochrome c